ncbi:MAG: hypothetical protein IIY21_04290 [Clostridiales bacterium]|nr:hypothetical protein [Clostridiales bacterium]MBQ1573895.1 hypothetical protein [Clostridiales bacterium]
MITFSVIQEVLSETFFDNNMQIAGLMMYVGFLTIAFVLTKNLTAVMVISIPVTLIFASMGILTGDLLIVMIIVTVIGLALVAGKTISGRD